MPPRPKLIKINNVSEFEAGTEFVFFNDSIVMNVIDYKNIQKNTLKLMEHIEILEKQLEAVR